MLSDIKRRFSVVVDAALRCVELRGGLFQNLLAERGVWKR